MVEINASFSISGSYKDPNPEWVLDWDEDYKNLSISLTPKEIEEMKKQKVTAEMWKSWDYGGKIELKRVGNKLEYKALK